MAGARALWVATGMKREQFGKPIIAIVNSFTQFVPGHTHLHEIGQIVKAEIEKIRYIAGKMNMDNPRGVLAVYDTLVIHLGITAEYKCCNSVAK